MPSTLFRVKPALLRIHRWIGLAVGLLILVQGATGALVAFRSELSRALHHDAMVVAPVAAAAPLQAVMDAAQDALHGAQVTRIDYPQSVQDVYLVQANAAGSGALEITSVDRAAQVTRSGGLLAWPVELAFQIHYRLVAGSIGEAVVGFIGLSVLILVLSGPLYWWPGRGRWWQGLTPELVNGGYRATRSLHRTTGVIMAPVLFLIAFTGLSMAWQAVGAPILSSFAGAQPGVAPKASACRKMQPLDDAVRAAQAGRPGQVIKSVRLKGAAHRLVEVYFRAHRAVPSRLTDHVWVDGCTAKIVKMDGGANRGTTFSDWLLPLHSGDWLGWPGRILNWMAAATLVFLSTAGFGLWLVRTRRMRTSRLARRAGAREPLQRRP